MTTPEKQSGCCEKCRDGEKRVADTDANKIPACLLCPCHSPEKQNVADMKEVLDQVDKQVGGAVRRLGSEGNVAGWEERWEEAVRPLGVEGVLMLVPARMDFAKYMMLENRELELKDFVSREIAAAKREEKGRWMLALTHLNKAERESVLATYEELKKMHGKV